MRFAVGLGSWSRKVGGSIPPEWTFSGSISISPLDLDDFDHLSKWTLIEIESEYPAPEAQEDK